MRRRSGARGRRGGGDEQGKTTCVSHLPLSICPPLSRPTDPQRSARAPPGPIHPGRSVPREGESQFETGLCVQISRQAWTLELAASPQKSNCRFYPGRSTSVSGRCIGVSLLLTHIFFFSVFPKLVIPRPSQAEPKGKGEVKKKEFSRCACDLVESGLASVVVLDANA